MIYPRVLALTALCLMVGAGCSSSGTSVSQEVIQSPEGGVTSSSETGATTTSAVMATSTSGNVTSTPAKPLVKPAPRPVVNDPNKPKPVTQYVNIVEDAFSPKVLVIKAGDTVVWLNKSHANHTVTGSEGVVLWESGNLGPNKSYRHVFAYPGTYNYSCSVHPGMKAVIVVR